MGNSGNLGNAGNIGNSSFIVNSGNIWVIPVLWGNTYLLFWYYIATMGC